MAKSFPQRVARAARTLYRSVRLQVRSQLGLSLTEIDRFRLAGWNEMIEGNLPLTSESVVWEFGGHLGRWSQEIMRRYGCLLHVFEPIPEFFLELERIFADEERVTLHRCAIGAEEGTRTFGMAADGTGEFAGGEQVAVTFESVDYLRRLVTGPVDLVAINIEGGEYELLPLLAASGILSDVKMLLVQFHIVGSRAESERRREQCRQLLAATHTELWTFEFVWEAWRISDDHAGLRADC